MRDWVRESINKSDAVSEWFGESIKWLPKEKRIY